MTIFQLQSETWLQTLELLLLNLKATLQTFNGVQMGERDKYSLMEKHQLLSTHSLISTAKTLTTPMTTSQLQSETWHQVLDLLLLNLNQLVQ